MNKKILSVISVLALTMLSADVYAYTDTDKSEYKNAIDFLTELKIVSGDNNKFMPEKTLSRAEAAKMLLYAAGYTDDNFETTYVNSETEDSYITPLEYTDLKAEHWSYKIMLCADSMGIIDGFDDGTVRPDDEVTYVQFLTMTVRALGYGMYADDEGGYPLGYCNRAKKLKLTDEIAGKELTEPLARDEAAQILYNALDVPLVAVCGYRFDNGELVPEYTVCDGTGEEPRRTFLTNLTKKDDGR